MKKFELKLTGSGGQGLILGGIILAEAALIDNKNAVQSQSYGPEARGGSSKAEVLISEAEIDFTKSLEADLLLCLTQEALNKYKNEVRADGLVAVDASLDYSGVTRGTVVPLPIIQTAREVIGRGIVANIISIGAVNALLDLVDVAALEAALLHRVPTGTEDLNRRSLFEGIKLAERYKAGKTA